MPEFLPTPQLPTGLAEQLIQLASQRNAPWSNFAQNLGQQLGGVFQQYGQRLPTSQAVAMGLIPANVTPQRPQGMVGPLQTVPAEQVYGRRLSPAATRAAEQIGAQEAGIRRAMLPTQARIQANEEQNMVPLTDETRASLKKAGIILPDNLKSVHRSLLSGLETTERSKNTLGVKDEQFWQKQWVDTGKDMDTTKASSRTPLGVATTNNQKAGRAMKLLNQKGTYTPQDQSLVTTDLTAMMKGGSPDEELLRQQQYGNLQTRGIMLLQHITSNPEDLNNPEVRQHLKEVIQGIVQVDNNVIRDHVSNVESTRSDVIARRPKDWEALKAKVLKNVSEDSTGGGPKAGTVENGYKFKGGDPADPKNWEKQ